MRSHNLIARTEDGVALAVSVQGSGMPLLLIPGLGATRSVFDPIVPPLANRYTVITFDPRGIGDSERGAKRLSIALLAADASAVVVAVNESQVDVLGASMGGVVAQQLAVDHHDRLRRLILAATSPGGDHAVPADPRATAALLGRGSRTPEDAYRIACTVLYSPHFQRTHPEFIEEQIRVRATHPVRPRLFTDQLSALQAAGDIFERLPEITAPTLVMHGTEDAVTPFENARILASRIPGAQTRWFQDCGHLFFHERPDESARVIHEFLRG